MSADEVLAVEKPSPDIAAAAAKAVNEAPLLTREQIDRIAAILRGAGAVNTAPVGIRPRRLRAAS